MISLDNMNKSRDQKMPQFLLPCDNFNIGTTSLAESFKEHIIGIFGS